MNPLFKISPVIAQIRSSISRASNQWIHGKFRCCWKNSCNRAERYIMHASMFVHMKGKHQATCIEWNFVIFRCQSKSRPENPRSLKTKNEMFFFLFIGCYKWLFRMNFNAFVSIQSIIVWIVRNSLAASTALISASEQIALWNKNV